MGMEFDMSKDFLKIDPEISNQKFGIVSIVTPEILKGCNERLIKFRGAYFSELQANDKCKELIAKYTKHAEGVVEVGKWIPWSDITNDKRDLLSELNMLMGLYLEQRKNNLINKNEDIFDEKLDNKVEENRKDDKIEDISNLKELKYLSNDEENYKYKYFCISFFDPLQLNDSKYHNVKLRAFKLRGCYMTMEEAKERCEFLHSIDKHHNTFIGETGNFVQWSYDPNVENDEYSNKDLDNLMKAQKSNQEKAKEFQEMEKKNLMNE